MIYFLRLQLRHGSSLVQNEAKNAISSFRVKLWVKISILKNWTLSNQTLGIKFNPEKTFSNFLCCFSQVCRNMISIIASLGRKNIETFLPQFQFPTVNFSKLQRSKFSSLNLKQKRIDEAKTLNLRHFLLIKWNAT